MNCQVILENEFHEKYLLDQLQKSEKAEYEKHLKQCVACGKGLEDLRTLIGGIRNAGREQMKAEILRQAEILELNRTEINWAKISRIAAVVFFFILTPSIIYYLKRNETHILPNGSGPYLRYLKPDDDVQSLPEEAESKVTIPSPVRQETGLVQENFSANMDRTVKKGAERKRGLAAGNQPQKAPRISSKDEDVDSGAKEQALLESELIAEATTRLQAEAQPTRMAIKPGFVEKQTGASQGMAKSILESSTIRIYTFQAPEDRATRFLALDDARRSRKSDLLAQGNWRFTSNGHVIDIHPKIFEEAAMAETAKAGNLPESFQVEIIAQDSTRIAMNWLLPESVMNVDARAIRLELKQASVLLVSQDSARVHNSGCRRLRLEVDGI